ncbi:hypothetical protein BDW59DRAFT_175848 [Aspergillus cavernicola]|uniref:alpha-galactosidase n=1 Tax=Aspergillus cavernicola TaxID=176166 RepID=A0ABR4HL63_9EURO
MPTTLAVPTDNCPLTNRGPSTSEIWQPTAGTSWQIVLQSAITTSSSTADVSVYDIDLFDNTKATINALHSQDRKVICYFSAGTYEDWRDDAADFQERDLGSPLDEWEGERWVDLSSERIRAIMTARLDLAVEKGCDGVDPDNVDAYDNEQGGIGMTEENTIDFVNWLADEAHNRGLAIGLKNAGAVISSVIGNMQWSVNEECADYNECDVYRVFLDEDKPVFHIEYPKGEEVNDKVDVGEAERKAVCEGYDEAARFSTLIKNMDLDVWWQDC